MGSITPYLAVSNNPVSFTDPDGGWDGDDGYDKAMLGIMERNNGNFLAASIEANGQMNWNGMSPSDRKMIQGMFGTSYKAQFENRIMDNVDAFGSYSERGVDYYYSAKRGVYGYWKDENTLTGAVKQFHTKSEVGKMYFHTTGNVTVGSKFNRIGGDAVLTNIRLKNQLRDNIMSGLKTVERFNPFSQLWDAASMLTLGTDKYGNEGSITGFAYAALGAFPGGNIETAVAKSEYSTIYRAVSQAEADDIVKSGFRTTPGGYEFGKLFAPTFEEAAKYGKLNFMRDGIPNVIMKVKVPNSILNKAYRFEADGMNALSIDAEYLHLLQGTPSTFSPLIR